MNHYILQKMTIDYRPDYSDVFRRYIWSSSFFGTDIYVGFFSLRCVQEWDRKEGMAAAYLTEDMGDDLSLFDWGKSRW